MSTTQSTEYNSNTNSSKSESSMRGQGIPRIVLSTRISENKKINIVNHAENSMKAMEIYFRKQELTDVILIAGDKRISAHRLVLGAASDYFGAMFRSSMRESTQEEIQLKEVDADALSELIEYCYTGCIELREENVETLFRTAGMLQLSLVVEACCQFLLEQLNPGNCLGIRKFADAESCADLSRAAHDHALQHFQEVVKNQEFLFLSLQDVVQLLESEDVIVPSEETIFHALMTWLRHDLESRSDHASKLLSCVKMADLSPAFIKDHITDEKLFKSRQTTQEFIIQGLMSRLLLESKFALSKSSRARSRKAANVLLAIGQHSIDAFDPENNRWKNIADTSNNRRWFGSAVIENELLVIGGVIDWRVTNTVKSFNFSSLSWNTLPSMNTRRCGCGVAVLDGFLYAVGGQDDQRSDLATVEKWHPVSRKWSYIAAMSTPRCYIGVAVLNNKLYAVGGHTDDARLNTVECYDPQTNKWTFCAPMSKIRAVPGVGVANECLYVVGGRNGDHALDFTASNSVERYDPKTDTWCFVAPMSTERFGVGVGVLDNRLFAVGGERDLDINLSVVEVYDPVLDKWQKLPPGGFNNENQPVSVVEVYDPVLDKWQKLPALEMSGRCSSCVVIDNSTFKLV